MNSKPSSNLGALAMSLATGLLVTGGLTLAVANADTRSDAGGTLGSTSGSNMPQTLTLTGICRDFKWSTQTGGHADFERTPTAGYAHYSGQVEDLLDADKKPVFKSTGYKVNTEATDGLLRNRIPVNKSYISSMAGDRASSVATSLGGSTTTAAAFNQWFRDVPGVNMSKPVPITLVRQGSTNIYSFSDRDDATYSKKGGFFPIDGELFGNSPGQSKNFGFTFELDTTFVFQRGAGQVFTFTGDDDVWVFIDGKLVVDIGGVHSAISQTIELDRLNWLQSGSRYSFKLFFAERHTTQSNVRIDTTINLQNADLPPTSGLYD
jgi:fibro-slime domain-containing protein